MTELLRSTRSNSKKVLAHIGALIIMTAWGSSFLSTKILMVDAGVTPVEMYVYRFGFAYLLLLCITFKKVFSNRWQDELQFMVCGICAGSLYFITENYALELTTAGNVSLLACTSPIFTTLFIAIFYKTKIPTGVAIGSLIAFAGVICIIFSNGDSFEIRPKGDLLAIGASLTWAIYTIVIRNLNPFYNSMFITRKLFFYGVVSALPLLFFQGGPFHLATIFDIYQPSFLLNFLFLVVMCSVLAYLIWNETMKILGSVTANNYLYLQPLVTMVSAYFVLGENIYLIGYIGCALIIGGLVLSDKANMRSTRNRRVQ